MENEFYQRWTDGIKTFISHKFSFSVFGSYKKIFDFSSAAFFIDKYQVLFWASGMFAAARSQPDLNNVKVQEFLNGVHLSYLQ